MISQNLVNQKTSPRKTGEFVNSSQMVALYINSGGKAVSYEEIEAAVKKERVVNFFRKYFKKNIFLAPFFIIVVGAFKFVISRED